MDYEIMMNGNVQIGEKAPKFEADSTMGMVNLEDYAGKWLVFFSHPGDFTPVCTTEIIAFSKASPHFEKLHTSLLGLSVDSNSSHLAWVYDIYCKTGVRVPFPIIADRNGEIARKYGMIANSISKTETVRNVYIIDGEGTVRVILIYPMNIGRCIPEILRIIEALQIAEKNGVSTPANWVPQQPVILPSPKTFSELFEKEKTKEKEDMSWYLRFQNAKNDKKE